MSRHEKLKKRFLAKPKDFAFDELVRLLRAFGYKEMRLGKTAGSHVAFYNENRNNIIRLHRPHPSNVLKAYQLRDIERELRQKGYL